MQQSNFLWLEHTFSFTMPFSIVLTTSQDDTTLQHNAVQNNCVPNQTVQQKKHNTTQHERTHNPHALVEIQCTLAWRHSIAFGTTTQSSADQDSAIKETTTHRTTWPHTQQDNTSEHDTKRCSTLSLHMDGQLALTPHTLPCENNSSTPTKQTLCALTRRLHTLPCQGNSSTPTKETSALPIGNPVIENKNNALTKRQENARITDRQTAALLPRLHCCLAHQWKTDACETDQYPPWSQDRRQH